MQRLLWLFVEAVNEKQVGFGPIEFDAPSAITAPSAAPSFKTADGILKTYGNFVGELSFGGRWTDFGNIN